MNFIELARAVRSRSGIQGTGPSSIAGAVGAEADLVQAVSDAWLDIQNTRSDWRWMREQVSFLTTTNKTVYTPQEIFLTTTNRFGKWLPNTLHVNDGTSYYKPVHYEYDTFQDESINDTGSGQVSEFTIRPKDFALVFNRPDSQYPVVVDYQKSPQQLLTDSDIPELPESFHMLIVYAAIEKYATIIISPELYQKASYDYARLYGSLMRLYLPKKVVNPRCLV